jgi:hypothetical protein
MIQFWDGSKNENEKYENKIENERKSKLDESFKKILFSKRALPRSSCGRTAFLDAPPTNTRTHKLTSHLSSLIITFSMQ